MYETLIINGYDLAQYTTCIQSLDGLYNIGTPRGDNIVFPGVDGETWVDKPFDTGSVELGLILAGSTTAEFNTILRELRMIVSPGQKVPMQRRLSYQSGNETHVCTGEFAGGLTPTLSFMRFGRVTLTMKVLDGLWYTTGDATFSVGALGSHSVGGETRTHRMEIDMPQFTTITNHTNGHIMSLLADANVSGTVTVDVESMTATSAGVDVSHLLTWNKRFPMRLEPGVNQIESSNSATIRYRAAYL